MIGKDWKIICEYKNMLIYENDGQLCFGNKKFTSTRPISVLSAKNRVTRYINKLSNREKKSLYYLKYELKEQ